MRNPLVLSSSPGARVSWRERFHYAIQIISILLSIGTAISVYVGGHALFPLIPLWLIAMPVVALTLTHLYRGTAHQLQRRNRLFRAIIIMRCFWVVTILVCDGFIIAYWVGKVTIDSSTLQLLNAVNFQFLYHTWHVAHSQELIKQEEEDLESAPLEERVDS
ncbi:hypothetical protein EXIGLDRAFT_728647 [Exidia glandulosa HHB12029]|uniref:Uncharacterized protein n=1 Tax=Exidia glandulosa HHB12029 TaxID=1314781 RepID=A0A165LQH2_EXIGL|nr:hypothetical protein EXIGLDRAFT_728647 [Exidia glandulosa HHB12029]